ncbi:MAG: putative LPS assembly protein LptD, partial [Cyclobacteriaceae bacterium]
MDRVNDITYLYGDAKIEYGDITIEAAIIKLDQRSNTLKAEGIVDSLGKKIGTPKFTDKGVEYVTKGMQYNFKTQRAISEGLVTEQNQGFIHGEQVYKDEEDNLYVARAKYTTCDLAHPHFEIRSGKIKRTEKNVITGPFNLWFNDVPTPLGLPFGMFPDQEQRTSGIVVPTYGEERQRGFFLRDGGYYFDINDHINLTVLGEVYSKGGWGLKFNSTYKKRYAYNGRFSFHYAKRTTGIEGDDSDSRDFSLRWNYTPFARGTSRFSASVNAATRTYNQNNSLSIIQNFNANLNSSISYSKTFQGTPFNMTMSARHSQNLTTGIVDITLPEMSVNMSRQSPFKRSRLGLLKNFNVTWNANLRNRVSNQPSRSGTSFDVVDGDVATDTVAFDFNNLGTLFKNAENGMRMNIPISTSSKIFRHFNISPSFNFNDLWYLEKLNHTWDEERQAVKIDTIPGFTRAGTYTVGAGLSTRIYGTFLFKEGKKIEAIRHTIIPSISFSYAPDFADPSFDYYQEVQVDTTGRTQLLSRYEGFVFGAPSRGNSGSIGFNLQNTLEMKVKTKNDTTKASKKIPLLRNLGLSTSYNLVADSLNLSNIRINASTNILNNLINFSAAATID